MAKIKLTKKKYLGKGYIHTFINDTTGETVFVPTTAEQYASMAGKNGYKNNPTLAGHTWLCSAGETVKVDTPDTTLGENDYTVVDGKAVVAVKDTLGRIVHKKVEQTDIINNEIDNAIWQ